MKKNHATQHADLWGHCPLVIFFTKMQAYPSSHFSCRYNYHAKLDPETSRANSPSLHARAHAQGLPLVEPTDEATARALPRSSIAGRVAFSALRTAAAPAVAVDPHVMGPRESGVREGTPLPRPQKAVLFLNLYCLGVHPSQECSPCVERRYIMM